MNRRIAKLIVIVAGVHASAFAQKANTSNLSQSSGIVVAISDSGGGKLDHFWEYELQLESGSVQLVNQQSVPAMPDIGNNDHETAATLVLRNAVGNVESCRRPVAATSPDGRYIAQCSTASERELDQFTITESATSTLVFAWKPTKWRKVCGYAWSPDGRFVVLLNHSEHYSKTPVGIFFGASGHPIPYSTVYLDVFDVKSGTVAEYPIRSNVRYVIAGLRGWSR